MKKYVSFEEAIKANIEGKTVSSWLDNETMPYNIHHQRYDELGKVRIDKFLLLGDEITRFNELKWSVDTD